MPTARKNYPLDQSPLYKLRSKKRLLELLKISGADLRFLAKYADNLYSEFEVDKRGGGKRGVENPRRKLKKVQGRLATLLSRIAPPDYLFCPVKGRCYVGNAAQHSGQRVIRTLDIRKYFPNTSAKRVFWFFHTVMQCERNIAGLLSRLATYQEHLPTGSPLSPIMAFFAHIDVWNEVAAICRKSSLTLTVYIDDITVSGRQVPETVMWDIRQAIHRAGLRYHKEKTYIDRPAEVTGVVLIGDHLVVPNRQLKKLHQTRRSIRDSELPEPLLKTLNNRLHGLNGQIRQIRSRPDR